MNPAPQPAEPRARSRSGKPQQRRVTFVIDTLQVGGAERHLLRLVEGLQSSGTWDPRVYCLSRSGGFLSPMLALGVPVGGLPDPWSRSPFRMARSLRDLVGWLRYERPDLVHCYLTQSVLLGGVAARIARVPHVITTRRLVHMYAGNKALAYRAAMAVSDRLSDAVIAVSGAAAAQAIREGTDAHKVFVVRNSVTVPSRTRREQRNASGLRFGTVGRLHPQKGQHDLIEAVALARSHLPGITLDVAGDGPYRADLEARVRELGLEECVRFLGDVENVSCLLDGIDVFVLPSHYEGLSNALLEAMAAGVPTIATDIDGVKEVVHGEEVGLLVPAGAPAALADAMIRLAAHPQLRHQLAEAGRRRVESEFPVQRELRETIAVYDRVLESTQGGSAQS